jgi:hypothetical protein
MASERTAAVLWLPGAFIVEVLAWEVGSRLELAFVDPAWEEFGRTIEVERIAYGLGAAVVVLAALFLLISRRRSTLQISLVQLLGVLGMACYWIGTSLLVSGAVVMVATGAAWVLSARSEDA